MNQRTLKRIAWLCLAVALLAGVTSAVGVFGRGDGTTAPGTSIRGETYRYATTGVYAFNAERIVAEGVGWDVVTLALVFPALLLTVPALSRGSLKARLLALGLLAYLLYQYLMYAMFWALGPLFPVFIVLYAASAAAIVWIASTVPIGELPRRFSGRFPARGMAVYSALMGSMLVIMWVPRIATGMSGDLAGAGLLGTPTLTVQAMDLGMLVPLAFATAVLVWRRRPWGYLLASVFAIKGVTMAGAICAMLVSAAIIEGSLEVAPFAMFAAATLAAAWFAWKIFASVHPEPTADAEGGAGTSRATGEPVRA